VGSVSGRGRVLVTDAKYEVIFYVDTGISTTFYNEKLYTNAEIETIPKLLKDYMCCDVKILSIKKFAGYIYNAEEGGCL